MSLYVMDLITLTGDLVIVVLVMAMMGRGAVQGGVTKGVGLRVK